MEFILLFAAILLIIFALSYFAFFRRNSKSKKIAEKNSSRAALVNCPICGSPLLKGQNIISKVYRPMNVPDPQQLQNRIYYFLTFSSPFSLLICYRVTCGNYFSCFIRSVSAINKSTSFASIFFLFSS